jgi:predicted NBD/HSP70 family sugar kinase
MSGEQAIPAIADIRRRSGINASRAGDYNRGLVIEAIRRKPGVGRKHIAADSGLTPSAITQIVSALMAEGLVAEGAARPSSKPVLGQPVRGLKLISGYAATIGLHFDHKFATAVLVDVSGEIIASEKERVSGEEPDATVECLARLFDRIHANAHRPARLLGVGVSVMGPVNHQRGVVGQSVLYPAWRDFAFVDRLSLAIGHDLYLAINGAAAGLGEYWFGCGERLHNFIYAFIGYGLGGALIVNRRVSRGLFGNAGEIGHINAHPDGELCFCGARGCLETIVSLRALARFLKKSTDEDIDFDAADCAKSPEMAAWIDAAGADLGRAMVSVSNIIDVPDIVLSGLLPDEILDRLIARARSVASETQIKARPQLITLTKASAPPGLVAALGAATMPLYGSLF